MWMWSLNWGEITPRIVIGSCPMTPGDLDRVRAGARVSAVLSLQHDICHSHWKIDSGAMRRRGERLGLVMSRCPMLDMNVEDQRRRLPAAVTALHALQAAGHRTYVHCTAGVGRAPLTVLGYLTLVEGDDPERVIRRIVGRRRGAVPSWEAYRGSVRDLSRQHRQATERRAYQLYERRIHGDPERDWAHAEAEVIRKALTSPVAQSPREGDR